MAAAPVRTPTRRRDLPLVKTSPGVGPIVILLGLVIMPVGLAISVDGSTYDTWGAFVWGPVLLALAFPLCRWVANKTGEPQIAGFLFGAAALKIAVGATARYYMVDAVYGGGGDSTRYDNAAAELVEPFRRGEFENLGQVTATRFIEILNGLVQAVIGQTKVGSFLVFATFGFVGLCLLYLAFCEAHPTGDRTLYRRLLFLTPTLWFWPSSIGKDAFLMLCIGGAAYGFARLLNGKVSGAVLAGLGVWGTAVVRPHLALILLIGAVAALPPAFAASGSGAVRRHPIRQLALPLLLLLALPATLGGVEHLFGIEQLNVESASEAREEVVRRTEQGGSQFTAPDTSTPFGLALGLATVAVRPFPWEASGFALLAAAESAILVIVLVAAVARRGLGTVRAFRFRWPRFALAYVLAFGWAFSAVSNFGILSRQRSLMLPFAFAVVAAAQRTAQEGHSSRADDPMVATGSTRPMAVPS